MTRLQPDPNEMMTQLLSIPVTLGPRGCKTVSWQEVDDMFQNSAVFKQTFIHA